MKNLIKKLLREELLGEIGTAEPIPFNNIEVADEINTIEKGLPVLHEIYYLFNVENEKIMVQFKLSKTQQVQGVVLFTYDFVFNINQSYKKVDNLRTLFTKMMTFKEIIIEFINKIKSEYDTKRSKLYEIRIVGIAEEDKGETLGGETQRTKLYDYFIKKFILPDFQYKKEGNVLIIQRNF